MDSTDQMIKRDIDEILRVIRLGAGQSRIREVVNRVIRYWYAQGRSQGYNAAIEEIINRRSSV